MKYCVENDLSLFEFHDSDFSFVSYDGRDLVVSVQHLNIHKETEQNPADCDMEIDTAQIAFKNFHSATYEPGRTWEVGEDGESYPVGPRVIFSGKEAMERIVEELRNGFAVMHFEKEDNGGYSIGGCGVEPYFTIEFDFDCVTVSWDAYKKKAWYELHRQYKYDAVLGTPEGDKTVTLTVNYNEEALYFKEIYDQLDVAVVGCEFDGKYYWGRGKDYFWLDAFAGLQKQLPEGVFLKGCATCRHGNLCPVGNDINEVFCTKDVKILEKSDLFFYTEDPAERKKRSRQYCSLCADYGPQEEDFFTYNDFFFYLTEDLNP